MKDIKVKEERGKAELPKMVRHAPKEFVRRRLATAKEKGVVQLMQAAQNGTGNSADTEDGMRPDAQTVVDSRHIAHYVEKSTGTKKQGFWPDFGDGAYGWGGKRICESKDEPD